MKVVIWGHKLHSHTHSYIHNSYYKAFKHMGFDVSWYDSSDDVSNVDFSNSIFFTEDQVKDGIPLREDCLYIAHHIDNEFFIENNILQNKVLNLGNYIYEVEEKGFEKINNCAYYDDKSRTLHQCWATDLLPFEIDLKNPCIFSQDKKNINYIGMIWEENINQVSPFAQACVHNNKEFLVHKSVSDEQNYKLIRDSFIAPDIRGTHHLNVGYIPCRVFKNISYGQVVGTNSRFVKKVFGDYVVFSENTYDLFFYCSKKFKNSSKNDIIESMKFVKDKHTFVNRVENILGIL